MNCNLIPKPLLRKTPLAKTLAALALALPLALLVGCGGGEVTRFEEPSEDLNTLPDGGNPDGGNPDILPPPDLPLALLPKVSAGGTQFADPNVQITLRGQVEAAEGAAITSTLWTQTRGTPVIIPNPHQLTTTLVIPDLQEPQELAFRLTVQDSEGRLNAARTSILVRPIPAFVRVIGGVANESDENAIFTLRLNNPLESELQVNYSTADGSALQGSDYIAVQGSLSFAAGETEQEIAVPLIDSEPGEGEEYFSLNVSVVSETIQSSNSGVMLILDNSVSEPEMRQLVFSNPSPSPLVVGDTLSNPVLATSAPGTGALTYSSGNPNVASVDAEGNVLALAPGEVEITATQAADAIYALSSASYTLLVNPPALLGPNLIPLVTQLFQLGSAIDTIRLENAGGGDLISCEADELPAGLVVSVSEDGDSCALSGIPQVVLEASLFTVTATNASGTSSTVMALGVNNIAPNLLAVDARSFPVNLAITPLLIENDGGAQLTECSSETLPEGLSLSITEDRRHCQLRGSPSEPSSSADYRISATNAAGTDSVTVSLTIDNRAPLLVAPLEPLSFVLGSAIEPVVLTSTAGVNLLECDFEVLPGGLEIAVSADGRGCELSGTPNEAGTMTALIFAANEVGSTDLAFPVEVVLLAPELAQDFEAQFLIRQEIEILIPNTGGPADECVAVQGLPTGLTIGVAENGQDCVLGGVSLDLIRPSLFAIEARNASGSSSANVSIEVQSFLALEPRQTKTFNFVWESANWQSSMEVASADIWRRRQGEEGFSPVQSLPINSPMPVALRDVALFAEVDAQYRLTTCYYSSGDIPSDCADSDPITVTNDDLLPAIGYLKSNYTKVDDRYGHSVAVSGNGQYLVVGAPGESTPPFSETVDDNSAPGTGAVYVYQHTYRFDGDGWQLIARLQADNGEAGDRFGEQVAISFNGDMIAVGAPGEDGSSSGSSQEIIDDNRTIDSGAVYTFIRDTRLGLLQMHNYIKATNPRSGDQFGAALALGGDTLELRGVLVVGAPFREASMPNDPRDIPFTAAGEAFVYSQPNGSWIETGLLNASNADPQDNFGSAVAISADGFVIAVGAPGEDSAARGTSSDSDNNNARDSGAVYLFNYFQFEGAFQSAYIKAHNTDAADHFGRALALNSNGTRLLVGAPAEDSPARSDGSENSIENAGAVYLFNFINAWQQDAFLKADNAEANDQFGSALSLSADGDLAAVGAPFESGNSLGMNGDGGNNSAAESGAAYTFIPTEDGWHQQAYIKAPNTDAGDHFGSALSLNNEGHTLAVGAIGEANSARAIQALDPRESDNNASAAGAAYIY